MSITIASVWLLVTNKYNKKDKFDVVLKTNFDPTKNELWYKEVNTTHTVGKKKRKRTFHIKGAGKFSFKLVDGDRLTSKVELNDIVVQHCSKGNKKNYSVEVVGFGASAFKVNSNRTQTS